MNRLIELFPITGYSLLSNDLEYIELMARNDANKDKGMSEPWNKIRMERTMVDFPDEWKNAYKKSYEETYPSELVDV